MAIPPLSSQRLTRSYSDPTPTSLISEILRNRNNNKLLSAQLPTLNEKLHSSTIGIPDIVQVYDICGHLSLPKELKETFFLAAVRENRSDIVKTLLADVDPNKKDHLGRAPLHIAAEFGFTSVGEVLLSDPRIEIDSIDDERKMTPLQIATDEQKCRMVGLLLLHGADAANAFESSMNGREDIFDLFLAKGISLLPLLRKGSTPLHLAVENGISDQYVKKLIERARQAERLGLYLEATNEMGERALALAARNETSLSKLKILLESGAKVDAVDGSGRSAIHLAAYLKNHLAVAALIDGGANKNLQDENGFTPLHLAACGMSNKTIKALIDAEAKPSLEDREGNTPLMLVEELCTEFSRGSLVKENKESDHLKHKIYQIPLQDNPQIPFICLPRIRNQLIEADPESPLAVLRSETASLKNKEAGSPAEPLRELPVVDVTGTPIPFLHEAHFFNLQREAQIIWS